MATSAGFRIKKKLRNIVNNLYGNLIKTKDKIKLIIEVVIICIMNPGKMVPGKIVPGKMVPGKMVHGKLRNEKSWGERRASWCVCGMFGCDPSMKTRNSTTMLPGLL